MQEKERQRGENSKEEEKHEKSREHRSPRNPERGSVIRSSLLSLAVVAGQCCRARDRGRPPPRGVPLSVISRGCSVHVACPPRVSRARRARSPARTARRRRRRQATRTMLDVTPGVTPPPRSDATATRYALYTRCCVCRRVGLLRPLPFSSGYDRGEKCRRGRDSPRQTRSRRESHVYV